ncbi:kinase phosphorylation protein-domain-containing protein [Jimgerdemannia flammicorona]|uniref:Kinase phosphorylation protein-domain-containing protein n=1 Tax=Jimgerdemannia flammicorona TaxID=994334 RepID=A0A433A4R7_9FUNG|nr:kinase phosphorylation protein-domain-containing protein [Jimgerdemannia flammicorona]
MGRGREKDRVGCGNIIRQPPSSPLPPYTGVRGGQDQFSWEKVKDDKDRENYLGHSVMAPVGRWQKGAWFSDYRAKYKLKGFFPPECLI